MPMIAISYRRSDSSAIAGRIFDQLIAHYGAASVFMDIDIPLGTDFRSHIRKTLQHSDVLLAIIGPDWLGSSKGETHGLREKTDPVRMEIETALRRKLPIIPILVDDAKMPARAELPESFSNFAYLNAAEVSTGRDFRGHMNRLIEAINLTIGVPAAASLPSPPPTTRPGAAAVAAVGRQSSSPDVLRYFVAPLVLLLVAHHAIVNTFDLDTFYLWLASALIPFACGFLLYWFTGAGLGTACAPAIALGLIGAAGMTVSQSLHSGDPIMPQTRFEWWDNVNAATIIALSFVIGYSAARVFSALLRRQHASNV
jgi:hypothetical protein